MDMEHIRDSQATDALMDERLSPQPVEEPPLTDMHEALQMRISEYQMTGLEKSDPFDACLVGISGDLMKIAARFGDTIERSLAGGPVTIEGLQRLEPAMNRYLAVARQVDRFSQLAVRAAEAQAAADRIRATRSPAAVARTLGNPSGRGNSPPLTRPRRVGRRSLASRFPL